MENENAKSDAYQRMWSEMHQPRSPFTVVNLPTVSSERRCCIRNQEETSKKTKSVCQQSLMHQTALGSMGQAATKGIRFITLVYWT